MLGTVVDANGAALPLEVKPGPAPANRRATHDVTARTQGQGRTRTVTFLRFGKLASNPERTMTSERTGEAIDFVYGKERWRVGLPSADASPWLAHIVDGRPTNTVANPNAAGDRPQVPGPR